MKKRNLFLLIFSSLLLAACNRMSVPHFHYYDPASQQWDIKYDESGYPTSATVTISCTNEDNKCNELTKTLDANIVKEYAEEPNCCEKGILRYIAQASFGDATFSKSFDFPVDKTAHLFEHYHSEKDGHAIECSYCKILEAPLEAHTYGNEEEAYYTCSVCGYVDNDRKEEYNRDKDAKEINDMISKLKEINIVEPYHEYLIRDIDNKYNRLKEEYRKLITEYDSTYVPFKTTYQSKYKIIFDDLTDMVGYNMESASEDTDVKVTKNQLSQYGYGFKFEVVNPSKDNRLKYSVSKPSYSETDNYEGVIYTHNVPSDSVIRIISEKEDWMVGGTDNRDLGNGWVERKINASRMKNLVNYEYKFAYYTLGIEESQKLPVGNDYFISCLYAIKPNTPTSGKHYAYKASTDTTPGNLEYWQYDGQNEVYLTNPDPSFSWTDGGESPVLSSSSKAYIAMKGTINVDTINNTNWKDIKTYDGSGHNKFETGVTGSSKAGGEYADFNNYQYTDPVTGQGWTSDKVGVDATYVLANTSNMRQVNQLKLDYYSYNPVAPVNVVMKAIDQSGNELKIYEKTIEHCESGAITETVSFDAINFYKLSITTKAFVEGGNGRSHFLMKNVSLSYKESDPVPRGNVAISTSKDSPWTGGPISADSPQNRFHTGSKHEWEDTSGEGEYLALRAYQWTDWEPSRSGLIVTFTNDNPKTVNNLSFKYYINSSWFSAHNFSMEISIKGEEQTTVIDTLALDTDTVTKDTDLEYSKNFDELVFKDLIIKITTNEPKGFEYNNVIFLKDMNAKYASDVPTGDVAVSTTDDSKWTYQPASANVTQNKIAVGIKNWWDESQEGDYLAMRLYQSTDWDPTVYIPGLTATFTNNDIKKVNKLEFKYFIHANNYAANNLTLKISIVGDGRTTLVDTLTLDSTVTKGADIDYSKAFDDELVFEKLILEISTNSPKGTNGNTIIFLKGMAAKYVNI